MILPLWVSCQLSPHINCLFGLILIGLICPVEVILDILQILNKEIAQLDLPDIFLQFVLLIELFLLLLIHLPLLLPLKMVNLAVFDLHLPLDPVDVMFLFPERVFLQVEIDPELVILVVELFYFLLDFIHSFPFVLLPLFPFFGVLLLLFKVLFIVTLEILLHAIDGRILYVQFLFDSVILVLQRLLLLLEWLNFLVKFFLPVLCSLNFVLYITNTLGIFDFPFQQHDFVVKVFLFVLGQGVSSDSVFQGV